MSRGYIAVAFIDLGTVAFAVMSGIVNFAQNIECRSCVRLLHLQARVIHLICYLSPSPQSCIAGPEQNLRQLSRTYR